MANLTEIAKQLRETFTETYDAPLVDNDKRAANDERYAASGGVEYIQIGTTSYVVINEVFDDGQQKSTTANQMFYNSINDDYAIIDVKSSATLIDEVYSRVTYMQRICDTHQMPEESAVQKKLRPLLGAEADIQKVQIIATSAQDSSSKANIFQCFLVKDTGVSAVNDTYSFMLKDGDVKEIPGTVMNQIRRIGTVQLLKDSSELQQNSEAIQYAVFKKYTDDDVDIQGVNVKSIFEIRLDVATINLIIQDNVGRRGVYKTFYFAGKNNEFDVLNNNIHACNSCHNDIVDIREQTRISHMHINSDAIDPEFSTDGDLVYAIGCEHCLVKCEKCGKWHFNYANYKNDPHMYDSIHFRPGREFIRGLRMFDIDYCSCRENIEWVYDENSGSETDRDVIPITKMAFVNYAKEQIATYADFKKFYNEEKRRQRMTDTGEAERKFAKTALLNFKKQLAAQFDMDSHKDVLVTNADKCGKCSVCGGAYYGAPLDDSEYTCEVCAELFGEKRRMVTRTDGVVFMRGKNNQIKKYVVTKLGDLKRVGVTAEEKAAKHAGGKKKAKR